MIMVISALSIFLSKGYLGDEAFFYEMCVTARVPLLMDEVPGNPPKAEKSTKNTADKYTSVK